MKTIDNRTYVIGRAGQIRLFDKTASSRHAELSVLNGDFYITDLNSRNGTYVMEGDTRKPFKEGYVELDQTLAFGKQVISVRELVARAQLA